MQLSQMVVWFFRPANEQVPVAVEPRVVGALDDPTAGAFAGLFRLFFRAPAPDVGRVAVGGNDLAHWGRAIARVQAQVLLGPGRRPCLPGGLHGERLARQRAFRQLHIVSVGPVQHQPDGNALGLGPNPTDPA